MEVSAHDTPGYAYDVHVTGRLALVADGESGLRVMDVSNTSVVAELGQYLRPSHSHLPVARYYAPHEFDELREAGLNMGFRHVEAGPLVRSSYHAWEQAQRATPV